MLPFFQAVVTECEEMRAGEGRTLVFTKNVAAANAAYRVLYDQGVDVMLYHREVPAEGRAKALAIMARCSFNPKLFYRLSMSVYPGLTPHPLVLKCFDCSVQH